MAPDIGGHGQRMKPEKQENIRRALKEGWLTVSANGLTIFGGRGSPIGSKHKGGGHWQLSVPTGGDGPSFSASFSAVIWIGAHGSIPQGKIVSYLDGNPANHRLDNLYLTDRQARTRQLGERAGQTKQARTQLPQTQVEALKRDHALEPGLSHADLAKRYGLSRGGVANILSGRKRDWKP